MDDTMDDYTRTEGPLNPDATAFTPTDDKINTFPNDESTIAQRDINERMEDSKTGDIDETQFNESYNHSVVLENMVRFQVEYHFSDQNLKMDNYLLSRMHEQSDYWVPLKTVAGLAKIRALTEDEALVLRAIRKSKTLVLNDDESAVKRPHFTPPKPKPHKDLRRTVFLYGLAPDITVEGIADMCCEYGSIKRIILDDTTGVRLLSSDNANDSNANVNVSITRNDDSNTDDKQPITAPVSAVAIDRSDDTKAVTADSALVIERSVDNSNADTNEISNKDNSNDDSKSNAPTQRFSGLAERSRQSVESGEVESPDRDVAVIVMSKKFGPRVIPTQPSLSKDSSSPSLTIDTGGAPAMILGSSGISVEVPFVHPIAHPNGNALDYSHLRTCFVVFESQSQANKCVKGFSRDAMGVRAMHQYDFNKARRKVAAAKARGISPLFSPLHTSINPSSPTFHLLSSPMIQSTQPQIRSAAFNYDNPPPLAAPLSAPHRGPHHHKSHAPIVNNTQWSKISNSQSSNPRFNRQRYNSQPYPHTHTHAPTQSYRHSQPSFRGNSHAQSHGRSQSDKTPRFTNSSRRKSQQQQSSQQHERNRSAPERIGGSRFGNLLDDKDNNNNIRRSDVGSNQRARNSYKSHTTTNADNRNRFNWSNQRNSMPQSSGYQGTQRYQVAQGPREDGSKGFEWVRNPDAMINAPGVVYMTGQVPPMTSPVWMTHPHAHPHGPPLTAPNSRQPHRNSQQHSAQHPNMIPAYPPMQPYYYDHPSQQASSYPVSAKSAHQTYPNNINDVTNDIAHLGM